MTTTRSDIHRPVEMDPADYDYVGAGDNEAGDPGARGATQTEAYTVHGVTVHAYSPVGAKKAALRTLVARADRLSRGTTQCHHCGARLRYFAVLLHTPTGEHIAVGETCLDNRFLLITKADFDRLRKSAALDRQAQRIKTAARAFVDGLTGTARIALDRETDLVETFGLEGYGLNTVTDIRDKIWNRYGDASPRAVAFAVKLAEEARPRATQRASYAADRAAEVKVAAPEGRQTFEGVVVARKTHESEWGITWKLTVKVTTEDGSIWLAWITEPSKAPECKRGDLIRVTATLQRSDRDESFAFGKRPSGLIIVRSADAEAPEIDALTD